MVFKKHNLLWLRFVAVATRTCFLFEDGKMVESGSGRWLAAAYLTVNMELRTSDQGGEASPGPRSGSPHGKFL